MLRFLIPALAASFLSTLSAQGDSVEGATPRSGPELWLDRCGEEWFAIRLDGRKAGHSVTLTTIEAGARGPVLRRRSRMRMVVPGAEGPVVVHSAAVEDYELEAPFALLRRREQSSGDSGRGGSELVARREDGGRRVLDVFDLDGPLRGTIHAASCYGLGDAFAEARWVAGEPASGGVLYVRSLDTDRMVLTANPAVLVQRIATTDGELCELERTCEDGAVEREWLDASGRTIRWQMGGLEFVRVSRARALVAEDPVATGGLSVVLDRELGDPRTLQGWTAVLLGPGVERLPSAGGQRVDELGDGAVRVHVTRGDGGAVGAHARQLALESTRHFPAADYAGLALEAVGDTAGSEQVARLCAFVAEFLDDDPHDADHGDFAKLLSRRRGDCSDHVQLFVTLARALRVPARAVTGWLADGAALHPHDWAEVELDGRWVAVDPTWNRCPADPDRLRVAESQRLGVLSSGFSVQVESVEHGPER